ncbi:MAG: hypothetical protein HOB79_21450 [Rhodospirillaceae bacterium]|nr:hypothetical protein [Rhodospirillales bacterium]MBT3905991.1 hypothetical protein [Rhodospirillaceae bacterium]MBT4703647.1 hypothetical protein [Rhodospirillaceae bacterium]MBT5036011.1 hypothetical protein [Rhodospirillaceae bacterium]MBT6220605.1 hypothetical protein [Rhodospirillaceae bacterium]
MLVRILIISVLLLVGSGRTEAAPQILGLIASVEATPMTCENGTCSAEFSTFCLQEQRGIPVDGTEYLPTIETDLSMYVKDVKGRVKKVSVADRVRIKSSNGYASVTISIPERELISMRVEKAALSVGKLGSLVPLSKPKDINPLSKKEIAQFTGPLRKRAEGSMITQKDAVTESRLTQKMINVLPGKGEVSRLKRYSLWRDVIGKDPESRGEKLARRRFDDCKRDLNNYYIVGMRNCLSHFQAESMAEVTRDVWRRIRPGS